MIENFRISGVIGENEELVNTENFYVVFISNQMHIYDMVDLINCLNWAYNKLV